MYYICTYVHQGTVFTTQLCISASAPVDESYSSVLCVHFEGVHVRDLSSERVYSGFIVSDCPVCSEARLVSCSGRYHTQASILCVVCRAVWCGAVRCGVPCCVVCCAVWCAVLCGMLCCVVCRAMWCGVVWLE